MERGQARCAPGICPSAVRTSRMASGTCCATCRCPRTCTPGYHRLEIDLELRGARAARSSWRRTNAASPPSSPAARGSGAWPCSSTRCVRENNWGIGDFSDLAELLRLAAAAGAGFVGISPVHALFPSDPTLYSPYSASSRHALNVMFIDVASVLEVQGSRRAQAIMARSGLSRAARRRCAPPRRWTTPRSPVSR